MKNQCIKKVPGVVCKAEKKDCDECIFYMGIGIVPIIKEKIRRINE